MENKPLSSNETNGIEKPASSLRIQFLSYITDFVFAVLVFIGFLLITWILHSLGNTFGISWFRFFWRLFELLVISFGTLWCVVFVIAEFAKKNKYQKNKPTKKVDDKLFRLHPHDIVRRFGEPCIKQPVSLVVCSLIVFAFLYVGISFAEIIRDDSDDVSILTCEMLTETGPNFTDPINNHITMLANYSKYLEHKHLASLLRAFSSYNPNKVFTASLEILKNAKGSQEKIANDIWRAGEEVMIFRLNAPKLLPRGIALHEYRKAPKGLLDDIRNALEKSIEAEMLFDEKPTMENAIESCMANRRTILLLFLARKNYNRPEVASLFTSFRGIVEKCRDRKTEIYGLLSENDPRNEFLKIISESENRRLEILDNTKNRNMRKVIDLMWEAIDESYTRRSALLKLCENIRSSENYSKKINFS